MSKHSRRDLLKYLGLSAAVASSPTEIVLDYFTDSLISKAEASTAGLSNKYVFIHQFGAPSRWMYDLFLKPYGGDVVTNVSVASELAGGARYDRAIYKTHKVKGINAPIMWTHNVGTGTGGVRPLSDLMDAMLVLQGMDALNPGHGPAQQLLNRPLTELSLDGALADRSNNPFASMMFGSNLDFKSKKGKAAQVYSINANFAKEIPKAFLNYENKVSKKYKSSVDRAVAKLNKRLSDNKLKLGSVSLDTKGARELMGGEIQKIEKALPAITAKYNRAITKTVALTQNLKGLTDKPIGVSGDRSPHYRLTRSKTIVNDADLRNTLKSAYVHKLAENFAIAEYVITQNLSSNALVGCAQLVPKINGKNFTFANDQHWTGSITNVLFGVTYFRIISACILELIEALKATPYKDSNMFAHTVIRQGGEFARHPRNSNTNPGSDHSPWSNNAMLLSGMIKGPIIAGDIHKDGRAIGRRMGSWGAAAHLRHGAPGTTGHVVSTIAAMLDIPSPSSNNPSLVTKNPDGSVDLNEAYIGKTKVV